MFLVTTSLLRALYLIFLRNGCLPNTRGSRRHAARTMIILGSGGHTTEILRIVAKMKSDRYSPRIYIRASTDTISAAKVKELEGQATDYQLLDIRRSREVHQPYLASLWTTTVAIMDSIPIVFNGRPDLILCNGPGTCIPICLVAFFYKVLFLTRVKVVFVESFCRVKTLSLSGKISYFIADFVLVRWQNFNNSLYRRTVYL